MEKNELAKMGQAIAEKFRGKAALAGSGPTGVTKPPESDHTTVEAGAQVQAEGTRTIPRVPEPACLVETIQSLLLELILDSPYQPRRRDLTKKDLEDLANNIAANGQNTPIIVTRGTGELEGKYHVHSGHRRCASMRLLGWTTVKAIVRDDLGEREARRLALMDNLGREDLSGYEQAMSFKEYLEKYVLDVQGAARELGLSRRNAFRLHAIGKASPAFLEVLRESGMSVRAADSLARLHAKDSGKAIRMARRFVDGSATVEEIEKEVTPGSAGSTRSSSRAKVVDLRVTANGLHLLVTLSHRPASPAECGEIRTALATFLWHAGVEGVVPQQPAADAARPMEVNDDMVEAA